MFLASAVARQPSDVAVVRRTGFAQAPGFGQSEPAGLHRAFRLSDITAIDIARAFGPHDLRCARQPDDLAFATLLIGVRDGLRTIERLASGKC